jgi:type IV pilus biogenesis protein CpaD/CtpE
MQIHPCLLSVTVALTLAACAPPAADFTESEWPKQLTLDDATTQLDIRFLPGSSRLAAADAARLRVLAANGSIAPADRVLVAAAGSPDLAAARVGAISSELLRYGVVATPLPRGAVAPNRATVEVVRYLVTLPPCPNWSRSCPTTSTTPSPATSAAPPSVISAAWSRAHRIWPPDARLDRQRACPRRRPSIATSAIR